MIFPIGFGTWPLGGQSYGHLDESEAIAAIERAVAAGVRLFDTANIYGDGRAEELLGKTVSKLGEVILVSKVGYLSEKESTQDFSRPHIISSVTGSLRRLRREKIEVLLLHSPTVEHLVESGACAVLDRLREEGVVDRTGVSLRTFDSFETALAWPGCSIIEVVLNLLDQRPVDCGLLERAVKRGVDVIARVPLCFGFLSGRHSIGATFDSDDQRGRWPRDQIDRWIEAAERFRWLETERRSLAQAALAFCIGLPGVAFAIPGMKSVEQVDHNTRAALAENRLNDSEMSAARTLWRELTHVPPSPKPA